MDQQEEGWPLGLNLRVGMEGNPDLNGSISFNTLLTGSPISSTDSSSDLDTESTGSFFHDKSITLGSLIGISNLLELSRRSTRGRKPEPVVQNKKINKTKRWFFSLCSRLTTDTVATNDATPSLGHFLEAERRATCQRNPTSLDNAYGLDDFSCGSNPNLLFLDGQVAPPRCSDLSGSNSVRFFSRDLLSHDTADERSMFSCLCANFRH